MVSPDEACTDYADILKNFEQGSDFLRSEFGVEAKIGWQLDAFGHSSAYAKLLADMGLEEMVFARISEQLYEELKSGLSLQFNWRPEFATVDKTRVMAPGKKVHHTPSIFAHVLFDHYNPPSGITVDNWTETFSGEAADSVY